MADASTLDVLQAAVAALQSGQRAALLTVVRTIGSAPRHSGAKMLVQADGSLVGTIGGGTVEERAVADAVQALSDGGSVLKTYNISGQGDDNLGLCGGAADVSIEVLAPAPRLVIIGAGHIGQALATLADIVGIDVDVFDDRPDWATAERFPTAKGLHIVAYDRHTEALAPLPVQIAASTAVVVATWGWDAPALRQILPTPAFYIGLVGSRRKLKLMAELLTAGGFDRQQIERIHAPAGLDLGGEAPGEIALSIMAEIQTVRYSASAQPLVSVRRPASASPSART